MRVRTLTAVAVGMLLAVGAVPAHANLIPILSSVTSSGGGFLWNYDVSVSADQKMSPLGTIPAPAVNPADDTRSLKDFVTFYDFGGFTGVVILPAEFGYVTYALGSTPERANPDQDLATFLNITVFRNDPTSLAGPASFTVSIESLFNTPAIGYFASEATKQAPGTITNNTGVANAGVVETPFRLGEPTAVPEPGLLLLMGASLLGLGMYRRRK